MTANAPATPAGPESPVARHRLQWLLFGCALLGVALLVGLAALRQREQMLAAWRLDMARHAAGIETAIGRPVGAADTALAMIAERATPRQADADASADQRIAYLDDNRMMASAARRLLERAGHRVHAFQRGTDLLDAIEAGGPDFDVVVTDFSMPEMSGLEVAQRVAALRPGTPVAIASGFVSDELRHAARRLGVSMVLRNEDSFQELAASVGRLLSGHAAEAVSEAPARC